MGLSNLLNVGGCALVVTVLVQLLKPFVSARFVPLAALAIGIVLATGAAAALGETTAAGLGEAALTGLLGGASAVGLYQAQKPVNAGQGILTAKADGETSPEVKP